MKLVINENVEDIENCTVYNITTEAECISFAEYSGARNSNRLMGYFREYGENTCFRLVYRPDGDITALVAGIDYYIHMGSTIIRYKIKQRSE